MAADFLDCSQFTQLLVDQQPNYSELILSDIRPTTSWVGNYETGVFPDHVGVELRIDRFRHVFPNTTKVWSAVQYANCTGTPCDKTEHCISWGSERITYHLEEQYWATQLLCFDQLMHVTHAEEQIEQIITKILRPATSDIISMYMRKRTLQYAAHRWHISAAGLLTEFTYTWTSVGDEEIYLDCSVAPANCGKLVPQALQVRFVPLMGMGYAGMNPFKETAPFIEIVTSVETCWELDRLGGSTGVGGTPSIAGNWRFTQFEGASSYWRYGFSGQIGNFMVRTDVGNLRFNYVGDLGAGVGANRYRYQIVLPYKNEAVAGAGGAAGLGSTWNTDFDNAHFELTFVTHKRGLQMQVADASPINPEMPYAARNFGLKWQFVMDNLGADATGCVIENKRRNKGQFIADGKLAVRPQYTEFIEAFMHKREPMCIPYIDTCAAASGYPTQSYESCTDICD